MRFIIALLLCAQVLLLGACGDEKGDLIPPDLSINYSADTVPPFLLEPTSDPVLHLSGTTDPDASIEVVVNTNARVDILINSGGNWAFDLSPAEGLNYVTISASDQRGNYNRMTLAIIHDETPPVVTIDQYLTPTAATSQIVGGTVETGSTVAVSAGAAIVGPVTVNNSFWRCELSGMVAGSYEVSVTATDFVGNPGDPVTRTIIVNGTAPLLTVDPVNPTLETTVNLTGSKAAGHTVTVTPPARVTAATVIQDDTSWSCVLTSLKKGNNPVVISLRTVLSDPLSVPLVTAGIVVVRDDMGPVVTAVRPFAGYTTNTTEFSQVTATFNEQLDPATITATTNLVLTNELGTDIPGVVSYDSATRIATLVPASPLEDGTYTATVKAGTTGVKDLLGNALTINKIWTFTLKTPAL